MPMLNTRFFGKIDALIKDFLTPVMLGKQRSQINQSVCYNTNQVAEWQQLIKVSNFNIWLDLLDVYSLDFIGIQVLFIYNLVN
jgi:hypothetical protein